MNIHLSYSNEMEIELLLKETEKKKQKIYKIIFDVLSNFIFLIIDVTINC